MTTDDPSGPLPRRPGPGNVDRTASLCSPPPCARAPAGPSGDSCVAHAFEAAPQVPHVQQTAAKDVQGAEQLFVRKMVSASFP